MLNFKCSLAEKNWQIQHVWSAGLEMCFRLKRVINVGNPLTKPANKSCKVCQEPVSQSEFRKFQLYLSWSLGEEVYQGGASHLHICLADLSIAVYLWLNRRRERKSIWGWEQLIIQFDTTRLAPCDLRLARPCPASLHHLQLVQCSL